MQPTNAAEISVSVQVPNTGSDSGTPACTINVRSPGCAYTGEGVLTAHQPLPKGGQTTMQGTVTMTNQAAHHVTPAASSGNCA